MCPVGVAFVVGTQISGVPHLGTSLVQSLSFGAAARVRDRFEVPVNVHFGAFDNAPHEVVSDAPPGHVMVKGGDWVFGSPLVDYDMQAAWPGVNGRLPARLFCPQVVTDTGAKPSRSLIRDGRDPRGWGRRLEARHPHVGRLVARVRRGLLHTAEVLLSEPRHFSRSYAAGELGRPMTAPATRSISAS